MTGGERGVGIQPRTLKVLGAMGVGAELVSMGIRAHGASDVQPANS